MAKLKNARHELFCQYYVTELKGRIYNATQSAIKAKYSEKTAAQQASRLLRNVKIKQRIDELKENALKALEIDQLWLLQKYKKAINGNLSNYFKYFTKDGKFEMEILDSDDVDLWNMVEFKIGKDGQVSFKIIDKLKAMQKMGEYMALFNSKEEDSDNDKLTKQLEQIQTIAHFINNPQPNRSLDDE